MVHETHLKLLRQRSRYDSRGHFFAIANRVMLRVLGDYHRAKSRKKRGGDRFRVTLSGLGPENAVAPAVDFPILQEALKRLEALDIRTSAVVRLRALLMLGTNR